MLLSKDHITDELKQGICELTIVSDYCSASRTMSATLSPNHLPDTQSNFSDKPNMVVFWDVIDEQWHTMHLADIGDIERMTGIGVKDQEDSVSDGDLVAFLNNE